MNLIRFLLATLVFIATIGDTDATSFYNPWGVQISFDAKRGERIIPALNRMRLDAAKAQEKMAPGDTEHSDSEIISEKQSGLDESLVFVEDYSAQGAYGVLLTDLLHSYGCVGYLANDEKKNRYEFTVSRRSPASRCTTFFILPESWQAQIREIGLNPFLIEKRFDIKRFNECMLSSGGSFVLIQAAPDECDRMRFLIREETLLSPKPHASGEIPKKPNKSP